MAEPWESLPDVDDGPAQQAASWEDLPDVEPASAPLEQVPDSPLQLDRFPAFDLTAPLVTGFTGEDVAADVRAEERARDVETVQQAFADSRDDNNGDVFAESLALAKRFNLPTDVIRQNLTEWRKTAAESEWNAERWIDDNPALRRVLLHNPAIAPMVVRRKELGPLVRAWHSVVDGLQDVYQRSLEGTPEEVAAEQQRARDFAVVPSEAQDAAEAVTPLTPEELAQRQQERQRRDAPRQVLERDDPKSQLLRKWNKDGDIVGGLITLYARAKETAQQLDVSRRQFSLMLADLGVSGRNPAELRAEIHDAQLAAQPGALGDDSGLLRDLTEGVAGSVSTVQGVEGAVKDATAAAIIGGVVGGVAGGVLAGPEGVPAGAAEGAELLAPAGAKLGAGWVTFQLETGSTYGDLLNLETDKGRKLTSEEAAGGAIVAGVLKTGLELFSLGKQTSVVRGALGARLTALMRRDPTLRALLGKVAKEFFEGVATEAITEGMQTAVDQVAQYVTASLKDEKAQQGPIIEGEQVLSDAEAGAFGAALFGGVTSLASVGLTATAETKAAHTNQQVLPLLQLAADPGVQADPQAFAQMVEDTTAESGAPVKALHVDAAAVARYFQEQGIEPAVQEERMKELLGPEGPAKLLEAVSTGGKLEVSLERVMSTWGRDPIAQRLADDTTTDPTAPTPRQQREQAAKVESEAQQVAAEEQARFDEAQLLEDRAKSAEEQLVAAGQPKQVARAAAAVLTAFQQRQAELAGKPLADALPEAPVSFAPGDEAAVDQQRLNQQGDEALIRRAQTVDTATRASELYVDPVSGLRTRRAWDASPRQPGTQVAIITSPDIKALNDHEKGGHDTANELLRLIGGVIGGIDPEAARSGTNFLFHARNREDIRAAVQAVRQALPPGLTAEGVVSPDIDAAFKKLDEVTKQKREEGKLLARGKTRFDLSTLGPQTFEAGRAATPNVSPELTAQAAALTPEAFGKEAYFDKEVPGVLSKTGFDALPPAAWVTAFDLKGLQLINQTFKKTAGDAILRAFGEAARSAGGQRVNFAHLSGDEYAAKHDNKAELQAFEERLNAALSQVVVPAKLFGITVNLRPEFRSGTGEKTYGAADRVLNARKRDEGRLAAGEDVQRSAGLPGKVPGSGIEGGVRTGQLAGAGQEVARLKQDTAGPIPKGYTETQGRRALQTVRVFLNKSADASTVIHETAHAFLEQLLDLAEQPGANEAQRAQAQEVLDALGIASRGELTREHHERFARSFEAYTLEGKAPSSKLKRAFAAFSKWLVDIYRTVRGIPGADLSPALRDVFDAMLATDEQVQAMRRAEGRALTAKELGVTPEVRAQQLAQEQLEYTEGSARAQLAAVKDALRTRERWWKQGLEKLRKQFSQEYEQLPARVAQRLLSGEETGKPITLDREAVRDVIGDLKVPGLRTAEGGVRPSAVAELAGFKSPRAMLAALAGLRRRETWVEQQAQAELRRLHPGILDDMTRFRRLLADGLRSATEARLERELSGLPREALKRAAALMVQRRRVEAINPRQALAQQRRAAAAKARAMAKGDITATRAAAREEMLNHFLHAELTKAAQLVERFHGLADRLRKAPAQARLGKALPVYRDAVNFILGGLGLGTTPAGVSPAVLQQAVNQLNGDAVLIGDPDWLEPVATALARGGGFGKLTLAEVASVRDALENLNAGARQRTQVLVDGKLREKEEVIHELLADMKANLSPAPGLASSRSAASLSQRSRTWWDAFTAPLLKLETMVDWLGGSLQGKDAQKSVAYQALFRPVEAARQREAHLQKAYASKILDAWRAMPKEVQAAMQDAFDGEQYFPQHRAVGSDLTLPAPTRRFELLMMALNAGNTGNLQRLTDGRNITQQQLVTALGELSKPEIDWVNSVGEAFDAMWPEIQAMEERLTGVKPEGVQKQPLQLKNGALTGHYFPVVYDRRFGRVADRQSEGAVAELFNPVLGRATTAHGHTKSRADSFVGVVQLEPHAILTNLQQHVHDLAFREALMNVGKLVLDPRVQDGLKLSLGENRASQFKPWLQDVARVPGIDGAEKVGWLLSAATKLRANITISALGYSVPNFFEDFSALPSAAFDRELSAVHLARGMTSFFASPRRTLEEVRAKSAFMRTTNDQLQRDLTHSLAKVTATGPLSKGPLAFIKEHAFDLIEASFTATATPIWLGRYRQALAAGETEANAVDQADRTVRRLFPNHSAVNAAALVRDRGFIGLTLQFFGFFSTAGNVVLDNAQSIIEARDPKARARAAGRMLGYMMAVSLISGYFRSRGPGDDEDGVEWALRTLLNGFLSLLPFGGDAANYLDSKLRGKRGTARPSLPVFIATTALDSATTLLDPDAGPIKKAEALLRLAGPIFGVPASQPIRTERYLTGALNGDQPARNPFDLVGGAAYGPPAGAGPFTTASDAWEWAADTLWR